MKQGLLLAPCAVVAWATVAALSTSSAAALVFTDIAAQNGIDMPDALNESVAWGDYDGDGDQDLYLSIDGPNRLMRNDGNDVFTDVSAEAGVDDRGFGVGCAFGDLDNDGDLDLYVVNHVTVDVLYRNDGPVGPGGAHVFSRRTAAAGTNIARTSRGVALFDYDRDGRLDIGVTSIGAWVLYHNLGGLSFVDVASSVGFVESSSGVGIVATDLNDDGWLDVYTGNRSNDPSHLFLNQGGIFTDIAASAGVDLASLGMGVLSFDYDNDLDFDLYWTTFPSVPLLPNALFSNVDGTHFNDRALASATTDSAGFGISCSMGDVDNDAWEDLFVTNGFSPASGPNVLFHNDGDRTFSDVTAVLGGGAFDGRGVAFADYDQDGDLDLCVTAGPGASTHLWRNDSPRENHFFEVELIGTQSNRSAIGARITVHTALGSQVKEVSGGNGRGNQNSLPVEFGLGQATEVQSIDLRWPNGLEQSLGAFVADQFLRLTEPGSVPVLQVGLTVEADERGARLSWSWPVGRRADRLTLMRSRDGGAEREVAVWTAAQIPETSSWIDREVGFGSSYRYRLAASFDGVIVESSAVELRRPPRVASRLMAAVPNPFNPRTSIRFRLAEPGDLPLEIVDLRGRIVRRFELRGLSAGAGSVEWDGRDEYGKPVASGSYVVRARGATPAGSLRLTLLK